MPHEEDELIFHSPGAAGTLSVRRPGPRPQDLNPHDSNPALRVYWLGGGGREDGRLNLRVRCWAEVLAKAIQPAGHCLLLLWKPPEKNKGRESVWNRRTRIWNRRCKWKSFILPPLSQSLPPSLSFFLSFFPIKSILKGAQKYLAAHLRDVNSF